MILLVNNKLQRLLRMSSFIAVFCLFCLTVGDVHAHLCLDGQEPAISLHFENLDGHPDHSEDDQEHNDYEYEIETSTLQVQLSKLSKLNHYYLLNLSFEEVLSRTLVSLVIFIPIDDFVLKTKSLSVLPPLRAPPVIS